MEPLIALIIFIPLIILIFVASNARYENKINEKVQSLGGTVISIERRNFFTGLGPFMIVGKNRSIYRFEYTLNNKRQEGWVRFGGLFGADWRL